MRRMPRPTVLVPHPHVTVDPEILDGSPHITGSRVPVRRLWVWVKGGCEVATLVKRYHHLGHAKVLDALAFAYDNTELIEDDLAHEETKIKEKTARFMAEFPPSQLPLPFASKK